MSSENKLVEKNEKPRGNGIKTRLKNNPLAVRLLVLLILCGVVGGGLYLQESQKTIYIEKAAIIAPIISVSPENTGVLEKILVDEGDLIPKNKLVAEVGGEQLRAKTKGVIVYVQNTVGQLVGPQDGVVKLVDPSEFRVIGRIQEDKGLDEIRADQRVVFTVDAFAGRQYEGVVESVAEMSRQSDIVFSISDKREEKEFDVKVRYDFNAYPELKNGMSAKMWIYK